MVKWGRNEDAQNQVCTWIMASLTTCYTPGPSSTTVHKQLHPRGVFRSAWSHFWGLFPFLSLYAHLQVCTNKKAFILQHAFIKEDILIFAFHLGLVWFFPVVSHPTTIKENKRLMHLQCFSEDIDKKALFSSYFRSFSLPIKVSKAPNEPGRVGEGCEGTAVYILQYRYCWSSLLSYTNHRQLQPYKF